MPLAEARQASGEVAQGVARVDVMAVEFKAEGWLHIGLNMDQDLGSGLKP
ncbi:hypothetical protein [Belnapia rosea]|uniref:Uncharacterized protein n=1 Tax=Belnapia rosea TaxID=938405 RepID=A0A1G6Z1D6_9PROT|nr:hypothetical protein [Belnapia rosea]SDD96342.1 hypothetical protein SAMN04487779_101585 [Belnapia rosea]